MIDVEVLITGGVGILSTITSGWVSYLFTKKKYNAEVDNAKIENVEKSVEVYTKILDDVNRRLDDALSRNKELEQEVNELKKQLFSLMTSICTDLTCQVRKRDFDVIAKLQPQGQDNPTPQD